MARSSVSWFPGHMAKAMRELDRTLRHTDLVLEVRDARLPFVSANKEVDRLVGSKRRLIVLHKQDLADPSTSKAAVQQLAAGGQRALLTSVARAHSIERLLSSALSWLSAERARSETSLMMVVGIPNCGKSSLINALKLAARKRGNLDGVQTFQKTAKTGPVPGLTQQISGFQVSAAPPVYVLDSPGVMMPRINTQQAAMKLGLIGAIKDSIIGEHELTKHLIQLLAHTPRHLQTLAMAVQSLTVRSTCEEPADAAGAAHAAAGSMAVPGWRGAPASRQALRVARSLLQAARRDVGVESWHPGLDDGDFGEAEQRLEIFFEAMDVAGVRDPSRQLGACMQALRAFRSGLLGRYSLDEGAQHGSNQASTQRNHQPGSTLLQVGRGDGLRGPSGGTRGYRLQPTGSEW